MACKITTEQILEILDEELDVGLNMEVILRMTVAIEHEQDMVLLEVVAEDVVQMVEVMVYLGEVALFNKEF